MITLYKGDDTHGQLGKKCVVRFHCDDAVDMNGVTVKFNLLNVVTKEFENVHDGDELEVFVSHIDSRKLPLGIVYGKLWGEDASGKIRTFANRIPFCVTMDLRKVYGSDGLDSVDVHVYSSVDWDSVANKPTLFPSKVSMVEGLEEALAQAGKVKTVNGQSPDENGNIEIEIPSCKVTSVNGKDGNVELTAQDIPYGGEGASNVETAIEQNTQAIDTNAEAIDSLEQQVGEIQTNTYTKSEVDDKINQSAAHYLTKRAGTEGNYTYPQFATHADLEAAKAAHTEANPQFFYGDEAHTPDKNDYCIVLADETHDGATTRYMFVGSWDDNGYFRYQYTINPTAFTDEQWAAINSLTSVDEDGNLCFDGIPFINSSGELLFTEEDPIFTAWKNEVQIVLGGGANIASSKYKQIAIGAHATANGQNAIALGSSEPGGKTNGPRAMAQNAVAIGAGANATATNSVQIFAGTNNKSGTIQLGNKVVAFLSDIPISQADIDDYRYYKGHWSMGTTYKTGDIVRAERTVEGQEEKEVVYFKSLRDNNLAQNPFNEGSTYWTRTTDDEGLEKLTLFVKAAIAGMTGADIPVSPTNAEKIDVALGNVETIYLKYDGTNIKHDDTVLTSFSALLALVRTGRIILEANATPSLASSLALFRPQLNNANAILFDATGEINGVIETRNINVKRKGTDGIEVVSGGLNALAKKSDIPAVVAPASDMALGKAADARMTGEKIDSKISYAELQKQFLPVSEYDGSIVQTILVFRDDVRVWELQVVGGNSIASFNEDGSFDGSSPSYKYAGKDAFQWEREGNPLKINIFNSDRSVLADWYRAKGTTWEGEQLFGLVGEWGGEAIGFIDGVRIRATFKGSYYYLGEDQSRYIWERGIYGSIIHAYLETESLGKGAEPAIGLTPSAKTALFADTAFSKACAYKLVTVGSDGVLTDRAINSTESATFVIPKDFTDLIVRFNGTPVSIDWATKETGITDVRGDDLPSESGEYLITFTRTKAAEAFIKVLNIAKE